MPFYDVTVPLSNELPTYPGDPGIKVGDWRSLANGDSANVSVVNFGAHTGTHVDAPAHFIEGAAKIESLPLDSLIGECLVVEVPQDHLVVDEPFVTANVPPGTTRVLFKTRNSVFWGDTERGFHEDYVYIDPAAAHWLVESGVKLVGIDYLSDEKFNSDVFPTHLAFLSRGVVIVEGLDLRAVPGGQYELLCLPLKIAGGSGDGAPARVILRTLS